ncbi:MarR family winged helix-turn-helix transcriptional regulator [Streptomyces sp. NPDC002888]|uniref:MarR family winged helix-turn-helix transcriptional regulator n=1 Tax=Streptomyces sp. NPDC002888 TaxID=3364668 RepID=UPI00367693FF
MAEHTVPATADPDPDDDLLAAQPIGYWSGVVHRAVTRRIRDATARMDVAQPQWWTLNRVDVGGRPTREQVAAQLRDVTDGPYEIPRVVDQLLHRGWLDVDGDRRLHVTGAGREAKARITELVTSLRAEVHRGIPDEDYVTTLRVLRTMIHNLDGPGRPSG